MAIISGTLLVGCRHSQAGRTAVEAVEQSDSLPVAVKKLVRAIADNDSDGFAHMVSYPLQRPYPLRDIENADQMKAYYKNMVDDSLRNAVTHAGPDRWSEYGWRGWSLDDGRYIWVDDQVYDVQYLSHKEKKALDSLVNVEIQSIEPSIRKGWRPVMCLRNTVNGKIYRIDTNTHDHGGDTSRYRLAVYNPDSDLEALPTQLIEGALEEEGTIGSIVYHFCDKDGHYITVEPETVDSPTARLTESGDSITELQRVYWHELVKEGKK